MAKRPDPLKEKQRRQKILLAVLGVLLIGLLAFQVPRVMARMHSKPPPSVNHHRLDATAAPPAGTPTLAAPTLQGSATMTGSTGSGSLASGTVPLQEGQLASFSRFASKDPFAQQLSDAPAKPSSAAPKASSSSPTGTGASGKRPGPGSAVISVNGTLYDVTVGTDFPQASAANPDAVPLFHLVALTAHSAKISIAGGSYSNGAATVTLTENKPLTLMNTADGTRYKLILKPQGTSVPSTASTGATNGTTSTTPSSSPATTVPLPPASP
jgi:hypothetical protein